MDNNNEELFFTQEDIDRIFEQEFKNYLALEKNIRGFMKVYKINPNENLKNVLLSVINHAKSEIYCLLEMVSNYFNGELKVEYSNKLGGKLNDLYDIEEELHGKVKNS